MRILIMTKGFYGGGTEVALINFIKRLKKDNHYIKILCINKRGPLLKKIPNEIDIEEIQFTNKKYRLFVSDVKEKITNPHILLWKVEKKLFKIIHPILENENHYYEEIMKNTITKKDEYDLLIDFHGYGYFLTAYSSKHITAKKRIMWIHDENLDWTKKISQYLKDFDKFYCVSETVKYTFNQKYPEYENKTDVFYNLINVNEIVKNSDKKIEFNKNQKLLLVTVGRLEFQKGFDIAVNIASELKKKNVDFIWLFIGDGNEYYNLKRKIAKSKLESNIQLTGRLENPLPYVKLCDIYIQPSRHEGFGLSVLEAKILKKPIIASNIGPFREQIQNNYNGLLRELDPCSFVDAILELKDNTALKDSLIKRLSEEQYNYNQNFERLYHL